LRKRGDGRERLPHKDTEDTTRLAQIEEVKRAIWTLPFDGSCGKKQKTPVQVSNVRPTDLACLQELLKRLQHRHVDYAESVAKKAAADTVSAATVSPDTPDVLQAMMQLQQAKSRTEVANKLSLETEKEKDSAQKVVEELKRQLDQREHALMMMLVMLMKCSQKLKTKT
jgi:hypothetical protein